MGFVSFRGNARQGISYSLYSYTTNCFSYHKYISEYIDVSLYLKNALDGNRISVRQNSLDTMFYDNVP